MAQLNPYLTFNNNCREAMTFYKDCLGGELNLMPVSESPIASQMPPQVQNSILHSTLKADHFEIMASDMTPEGVKEGNDVHMCISLKTVDETRKLFDELSAGGKVTEPLSEMFFGWICAFKDKFGKRWMLVCEKAN